MSEETFKNYLNLTIKNIKKSSLKSNHETVYNEAKLGLDNMLKMLSGFPKNELRKFRTVDGYLFHLSNGLSCKLLGDNSKFIGFSIYNLNNQSTRFILNDEQKSFILKKFDNLQICSTNLVTERLRESS